jgi:hypothetical protein
MGLTIEIPFLAMPEIFLFARNPDPSGPNLIGARAFFLWMKATGVQSRKLVST